MEEVRGCGCSEENKVNQRRKEDLQGKRGGSEGSVWAILFIGDLNISLRSEIFSQVVTENYCEFKN